MKNKLHYIAGSINSTKGEFKDGYEVVFKDAPEDRLLISNQLPGDIMLDLEKKLEDPIFLARYYLEKEYNIKNK